MAWVWVVWARRDDGPLGERLIRHLVESRYGSVAGRVRTGRLCPRCGSGGHGRPGLRGFEGPGAPGVSIARTAGVTVVALSACAELGVDVERLDRFSTPGVADVVLHPAERATGAVELATAWVRKEALLKASGEGLTVDPAAVRLGNSGGSPVVVDWPPSTRRPDWLIDLALADDLRGAVAGSGARPGEVRVRRVGRGGRLG